MKKIIIESSVQFGIQLKKYLEHFGLIETDIAKAIGSSSKKIVEIINGQKGVMLETIDTISGLFKLTYYEMGNPNFPFPSFQDLPLKMQGIISKRKELGFVDRDYGFDLGGKLDLVIASDFLEIPRTSEAISMYIEGQVGREIQAVRITDLLGRSPRNKLVIKVGKERSKNLYQLKVSVKNKGN